MQCGGAGAHIPKLIKAFKMACLTYNPSTVFFESREYQRNQLIES